MTAREIADRLEAIAKEIREEPDGRAPYAARMLLGDELQRLLEYIAARGGPGDGSELPGSWSGGPPRRSTATGLTP